MTHEREITRAATYERISLDRYGDGRAVERQAKDNRDLAARRDWVVVAEHTDNDTSAAGTKKRPGFEALLADVEARRVDVVIAWALDRLTRNRRDTVRLIEACQKASVSIALVRGSDIDLTSPAGRLTADILASVARAEIETKGDRQVAAYRQQVAQGKPIYRARRFGYQPGNIEPDEKEAALLREAYASILAGGSLSGVAREWNTRGIRGVRGARWSATTVSQSLANPVYCGLQTYKGEPTGTKGAWTAVIDEDTWRAFMAVIDPRRVGKRTGKVVTSLLSGIARCGKCSGEAHLIGGQRSRGKPTYRCGVQPHMARQREPIDELVIHTTVVRLSRADAVDLVKDEERMERLADLRGRAAVVRARLEEFAIMLGEGEMTREQFATATSTARASLERLDAEQEALAGGNVLAGIVGAPDVRAAWDALDIDRQRAIVSHLWDIVVLPATTGHTFDPATVTVEPKEHPRPTA